MVMRLPWRFPACGRSLDRHCFHQFANRLHIVFAPQVLQVGSQPPLHVSQYFQFVQVLLQLGNTVHMRRVHQAGMDLLRQDQAVQVGNQARVVDFFCIGRRRLAKFKLHPEQFVKAGINTLNVEGLVDKAIEALVQILLPLMR